MKVGKQNKTVPDLQIPRKSLSQGGGACKKWEEVQQWPSTHLCLYDQKQQSAIRAQIFGF